MALTKKWAANGIKSPIPNDPQGDNLVNYDEGFTTLYRTPIKDGGKPIGLDTFNQLMYDITDEVIENKSTLNQVAQQVRGVINDTQTSLTSTWSSQLIDNKISTAAAGVINDARTSSTTTWSSQLINNRISTAAANIIDDNQITSTLTWSSVKISAEIGQASAGGGNANIDDNTISTDKVWSSFKTNEMVKGGRTISVSNWEAKEGSGDTTITNTTANAKMVNLSVKVKTNATADKYLGDVVVYYNDPSNEILRQSCVSQNITGATDLTSAMGMTILDAQDSLIIKSTPASGVQDFWDNVKLMENTSNVTGSAPEPEPLGEGLIFTAQASSSSVTFSKAGTPTELQLEYQTIKADVTSGWQPYTLGTTIDLDANDKVAFRNTGTQTITQTNTNYHYFTMTGEIKAENDLTYLFSSTGGVDTIAEYGCYKMFRNCSALTEMPDLTATNIGANGYAYMFNGCTKLKTIKPLPATTLASYCYSNMFNRCTSLTTAPSLPATTLADNCYSGMFNGCTSLTTAPSLPATTLADYCYRSMFDGCTSLTTAPELPATTLADYCYRSMFGGCTSLTTAPELPATTLANFCYRSMFGGCTKLKVNQNSSGTKIFTCPSTSGLTAPVDDMFANTGGTFTGTPTANNSYFYNATMPATGMLRFTAQQASSSVTLNKEGSGTGLQLEYRTNTNSTWQNYTLGTQINLANIDDWVEMRNRGLQTLNNTNSNYHQFKMTGRIAASGNIQYLLDKTGGLLSVSDYCYYDMFFGCPSLTTAPELPATTLADYCYQAMFVGCTSLTTAPSLPATTLANSCYNSMFQGCTNLKVNQNGSGTKIFTCPNTSGVTRPVQSMFLNTGGSFTDTPTTGNTYNWYN